MSGELARYFLTRHPRDAMRVIESASASDRKAYLSELGTEEQALVLSHLLPETAGAFLAEIDDQVACAVIERLRTVDAVRVVAGLPLARRTHLLNELPNEKRETIRHRLRYPDDSVGALMNARTLVCRDDADIRHAKRIVRRFGVTDLPMMVVVDDDMRPVGLIPVTALIAAREREAVVAHMRSVPASLRANEEIRGVLSLPAWTREDHLPVIANDGQYVGLLAKSQLHAYVLAARRRDGDANNLSMTLLAIADTLWSPAAELLARAGTAHEESGGE